LRVGRPSLTGPIRDDGFLYYPTVQVELNITQIYRRPGEAKNPTLKVLLGLAKGLDVPPIDVFKAAAGIDDGEEAWDAQSITVAIQKMLRLKPSEIREIKRVLKIR
jgi:hypothetical protein